MSLLTQHKHEQVDFRPTGGVQSWQRLPLVVSQIFSLPSGDKAARFAVFSLKLNRYFDAFIFFTCSTRPFSVPGHTCAHAWTQAGHLLMKVRLRIPDDAISLFHFQDPLRPHSHCTGFILYHIFDRIRYQHFTYSYYIGFSVKRCLHYSAPLHSHHKVVCSEELFMATVTA